MKFLAGGLAGAPSGSVGGLTASHNRYGYYYRARVIPIKRTTEWTLGARGRLIDASQAWGLLSSAEQLAWDLYAESAPITDALGSKQVLTGHAAYVQINSRILLAGGTKINVPPAVAAPPALTVMTTTYDIGLGTSTIVYTVTPLAAGNCLYVQGAVLLNPGQRYFQNRLKLIDVTAAAQASPYDYQAKMELRFGPLVVGQRVVLMAAVLSNTTGLLSAPYMDTGVIVSTP